MFFSGQPARTESALQNLRSRLTSDRERDYFLTHQNRYRFILKKIAALGLPPGATVLDIVCFPLHLFKMLEGWGYRVSGVSSDHEKIKTAKIHSLNIEIGPLPYPDNHFDLIIFAEVMEHLLYNPGNYLQEIYRVLKPGGTLFITTPNSINIKNRLLLLGGRSCYPPLFQLLESEPDNGYIYHRRNREYTLSELEQLLKPHLFKIKSGGHFNAYSPLREKLHPNPRAVRIIKGVVFLPTVFFSSLRDTNFILAAK